MSKLIGRISQVIGPVVDVYFNIGEGEDDSLPSIHDALEIERPEC